MFNSDGVGLKIKQVNETGNPFAINKVSDNYLLTGFPMLDGAYNGVLYTDKVTASGSWQ